MIINSRSSQPQANMWNFPTNSYQVSAVPTGAYRGKQQTPTFNEGWGGVAAGLGGMSNRFLNTAQPNLSWDAANRAGGAQGVYTPQQYYTPDQAFNLQNRMAGSQLNASRQAAMQAAKIGQAYQRGGAGAMGANNQAMQAYQGAINPVLNQWQQNWQNSTGYLGNERNYAMQDALNQYNAAYQNRGQNLNAYLQNSAQNLQKYGIDIGAGTNLANLAMNAQRYGEDSALNYYKAQQLAQQNQQSAAMFPYQQQAAQSQLAGQKQQDTLRDIAYQNQLKMSDPLAALQQQQMYAQQGQLSDQNFQGNLARNQALGQAGMQDYLYNTYFPQQTMGAEWRDPALKGLQYSPLDYMMAGTGGYQIPQGSNARPGAQQVGGPSINDQQMAYQAMNPYSQSDPYGIQQMMNYWG